MPDDALILIDHDDPSELEELARALSPLGLRLARATDGKQALALSASLRPALVVAGLPLRGLPGTRLVAALRELDTPVLFRSPAVLASEIGTRVSFAPSRLAADGLRTVVEQALAYRNRSSRCRASRALTP